MEILVNSTIGNNCIKALLILCKYGFLRCAEILIECKAEIESAFIYCCDNINEEVSINALQMLLVHANNIKWHKYKMNVIFRNSKTTRLLIDNSIDVKYFIVEPPVVICCRYGYEESLEVLIECKADLSYVSVEERQNLLHIACCFRHYSEYSGPDILQILLNHINVSGAVIDINAVDNEGNTPLLIACKTGFPYVVELLLSANSDTSISNNEGSTALNIAGTKKIRSLINSYSNQTYILK
jgi:ankyrin repeat protein